MTESDIQKQLEFKPVNPMNMSEEEGLAWNAKHNALSQDNGVFIRYIGIEPFMRFIKEGSLVVGSNIRLTDYGRIRDPHFVITSNGLVGVLPENKNTLSPQEVFKTDKNGKPPTWEIVGYTPILEESL